MSRLRRARIDLLTPCMLGDQPCAEMLAAIPLSARCAKSQKMQSKSVFNNFTKFFVLQTVGEAMALGLSIPVPGAVIAMLLLFFYLLGRENGVVKMAASSNQFLCHLVLCLLPAATTLFSHAQRVGEKWVFIIAAFIISALVSLIVSHLAGRWFEK
jgi:holin-like protein